MKYIGVKIVEAVEMVAEEAREVGGYRTGASSGYDDGYEVTYPDGYKSWCPKDVFDKANRQCDAMSFGYAIEALKHGMKVCRAGWNEKNMFVYLVKETSIPKENLRNECFAHVGPLVLAGASLDLCSHIDMKAADGSIVVGWLASHTDMLADDWMIVE